MPDPLRTDFTNETPQANVHPEHHAALAEAVNQLLQGEGGSGLIVIPQAELETFVVPEGELAVIEGYGLAYLFLGDGSKTAVDMAGSDEGFPYFITGVAPEAIGMHEGVTVTSVGNERRGGIVNLWVGNGNVFPDGDVQAGDLFATSQGGAPSLWKSNSGHEYGGWTRLGGRRRRWIPSGVPSAFTVIGSGPPLSDDKPNVIRVRPDQIDYVKMAFMATESSNADVVLFMTWEGAVTGGDGENGTARIVGTPNVKRWGDAATDSWDVAVTIDDVDGERYLRMSPSPSQGVRWEAQILEHFVGRSFQDPMDLDHDPQADSTIWVY